jgi:uncharacterized protein involved in exopolysaccharide biosynthesis
VFLGVFAVACLLGITYTFMRPAVYQSTAILVMASPVAGEQGDQASRSERVALQREILTSHSLLIKVLDELSPIEGSRDGLPRTVDDLNDMISVSAVGEAEILQVRAEGAEPKALPVVVNTWIDTYLSTQAASRKTTADSADAALRQQSEALSEKVADKRRALENFRQQNDILSMERDENRTLAKLKGLSDSLNKASEEEVNAEARLNAMRAALADGKPVARIEDERSLANLEQRATQLREQLKGYEERFTPAYMELDPNIKALQRNLAKTEDDLRSKRREAQQAALTESEQELASARQASGTLQQQLDEYKQTVATFTARFAEHSALQEELGELEQLYRDVQQRLVQTEVISEHQLPRLEVLERAYLPERPVRPLYLRDAAISVAAAFVLGMLAVWLYEFFTRRGVHPIAAAGRPFFYRITERAQPVAEFPVEQPAPAIGYESPRELTQAEVMELIEAANEVTGPAIMALLHGLSVEEVAGLRWADVDLDQDQIRLGGRQARTVPLAPRLREYLTALPPQGRSGELALWVGEEGGHAEPAELDAMVETAAYDAGLTRPAEITSRALRHTYLLFLVRQGARLRDLGRVAGHIPPTELVTYGKLCPPGQGLPLEQVELIYPSLKQPA